MDFYNWTLRVSAPLSEYFMDSRFPQADVAMGITSAVTRASHAARQEPEAFYEWLANMGCAATNVVFFDGPTPSHPTKVNLILVSPDHDLACAAREERPNAPKFVNYFYTIPEWLRERPFDSSLIQFPQWVLGALSAPHAVLTIPGKESAFEILLLGARDRVMCEPDSHLAELIAADIYAAVTSKLPQSNSIRRDLDDFRRDVDKFGLSDREMEKMAMRSMERRGLKQERRKPVMSALAGYAHRKSF